MTLFTEDSDTCAAPPARLAARFYRKSSSRRKSSANSSRRSSLSSIHSHQSALSSHGGPQSTHIAQHLRRASIIESRKARLADRAAHAEQVRLRAAAARASQRVLHSEEKLLAAQAAREKLLAEIASRCEEEVRRAKKIAEETREKKAAEHARLKEEIAEKFAEAARRRSLYQHNLRRPRTTSLTAVEEKNISPAVVQKLDQAAAATVIQSAWRRHRARRILADFLALDLRLKRVKELTFEQVSKLLAEEQTTVATASLLKHVGILDGEEGDVGDRGGVRVFLSAYMILAHPAEALSHGGTEPQEQELMTKAMALVEAFESYLPESCSGSAGAKADSRMENLSYLYNDFSSTFHAWKSQDLGVLVDVMVNSFVNMDLILQATKNDQAGRVADDYLDAVRQEQIKILARLKRLAGPEEALSRVKAAVRKARRQRALEQRNDGTEQIPRSSTEGDGGPDLRQATLPTPPGTPPPLARQSDGSSASFVRNLGHIMTVLPSNREIAHEMQINGIFEVQQQPWTDSRRHLMESLQSSMRQSMKNGGGEVAVSWTRAMAELIRDKLLNLISPRHPLFDRIDGLLDLTLIDQQCRNGMFSYSSFFGKIADLIAQICSPGRDEAVRAFASDTTSDTIDRLFALINIIDLMTLDHINFQFRMAAQSVIQRGHEHEIAAFEQNLRDGAHSLEQTKRWWATARSNLAFLNPNGTAIYARGLVDLVLSNVHVDYRAFPETLQLDYVRLLKLRARAFHVVAAASILLTTKIRLRRNREAIWSKDAERLMFLDLLTTDVARIVSLIESSHMMPDSTREGLSNFVGRVLPSAVVARRNATNAERDHMAAIQDEITYNPALVTPERMSADDVFSEQIASFLLKSLREHVFARLSANGTAERVRVTTSAGEVLARAGMPEFLEEVNRMTDLLERVRAVDLKAHTRWYDEVAQDVVAGRS